ncbi:hypothetical protein PoB_001749900 [Plakobranchus ocellatus]|uniref:Uncharacterized protein n=1 Tax=Plakobranchus ocellatus TaxID=259542 RepID=A0AAV3Z9B0_9GAST|nr:hypothetical protein PoB_001749900 [Plakobranchus ocellatus]
MHGDKDDDDNDDEYVPCGDCAYDFNYDIADKEYDSFARGGYLTVVQYDSFARGGSLTVVQYDSSLTVVQYDSSLTVVQYDSFALRSLVIFANFHKRESAAQNYTSSLRPDGKFA